VHRAVAQRPWFTEDNVELASAEAVGSTWTEAIAPGKDLAAIRQMPADDLVGDGKVELPMRVIVDGHFLPRSAESIFTRASR